MTMATLLGHVQVNGSVCSVCGIMNVESARFASFRRWPHPSNYGPSPVKLAKSGFFHSPSPNYPDRTLCFCCGIALVHWNKNHDPWTEHIKRSPTCGLVTGAYNHYREETARLKSLEVWPVPAHFAATPEKLAKAGFFKAVTDQFQDRCVCFCCGIALVRWEPNDDPWTEHKKYSKHCPFTTGANVGNVPLPEAPEQQAMSGLEKILAKLDELDVDPGMDAPSFYLCPIMQDFFVDPVVAEDGHSYERSAIKTWLEKHNTSPLTNKMMYSKRLIPNHNLHAQLMEYAENLLRSATAQQAESNEDAPSEVRAESSDVEAAPMEDSDTTEAAQEVPPPASEEEDLPEVPRIPSIPMPSATVVV